MHGKALPILQSPHLFQGVDGSKLQYLDAKQDYVVTEL